MAARPGAARPAGERSSSTRHAGRSTGRAVTAGSACAAGSSSTDARRHGGRTIASAGDEAGKDRECGHAANRSRRQIAPLPPQLAITWLVVRSLVSSSST